MAAPTFQSQTHTLRSTTTTDWTGAGPSTCNVGDFLVAFLLTDTTQTDSTGSTTGSLPTAPSGWTEILAGAARTAGGDVCCYAYYKVADSADADTPPNNYSWTTSSGGQGSIHIMRFTGVDTTTPVDDSDSAVTAAGATSITLPAVTTTVADCLLLAMCGVDESSSTYPPYWSDPPITGWTAVFGSSSVDNETGGSTVYAGIAVVAQAGTGSSGTKTMTIAAQNDAITGIIVALRPTASATKAIPVRSRNRSMRQLLVR